VTKLVLNYGKNVAECAEMMFKLETVW